MDQGCIFVETETLERTRISSKATRLARTHRENTAIATHQSVLGQPKGEKRQFFNSPRHPAADIEWRNLKVEPLNDYKSSYIVQIIDYLADPGANSMATSTLTSCTCTSQQKKSRPKVSLPIVGKRIAAMPWPKPYLSFDNHDSVHPTRISHLGLISMHIRLPDQSSLITPFTLPCSSRRGVAYSHSGKRPRSLIILTSGPPNSDFGLTHLEGEPDDMRHAVFGKPSR
jgi:hypothetical protein